MTRRPDLIEPDTEQAAQAGDHPLRPTPARPGSDHLEIGDQGRRLPWGTIVVSALLGGLLFNGFQQNSIAKSDYPSLSGALRPFLKGPGNTGAYNDPEAQGTALLSSGGTRVVPWQQQDRVLGATQAPLGFVPGRTAPPVQLARLPSVSGRERDETLASLTEIPETIVSGRGVEQRPAPGAAFYEAAPVPPAPPAQVAYAAAPPQPPSSFAQPMSPPLATSGGRASLSNPANAQRAGQLGGRVVEDPLAALDTSMASAPAPMPAGRPQIVQTSLGAATQGGPIAGPVPARAPLFSTAGLEQVRRSQAETMMAPAAAPAARPDPVRSAPEPSTRAEARPEATRKAAPIRSAEASPPKPTPPKRLAVAKPPASSAVPPAVANAPVPSERPVASAALSPIAPAAPPAKPAPSAPLLSNAPQNASQNAPASGALTANPSPGAATAPTPGVMPGGSLFAPLPSAAPAPAAAAPVPAQPAPVAQVPPPPPQAPASPGAPGQAPGQPGLPAFGDGLPPALAPNRRTAAQLGYAPNYAPIRAQGNVPPALDYFGTSAY